MPLFWDIAPTKKAYFFVLFWFLAKNTIYCGWSEGDGLNKLIQPKTSMTRHAHKNIAEPDTNKNNAGCLNNVVLCYNYCMFDKTPDPIAFTIFGIDVRWYGILVAAGIMFAVLWSYKRFPKHGLDQDSLMDIALISIPCGIIGARLYYVIFQWDNYSGDIARILDIRSGGLAVHGGLIAGFLAAYLVCRHKKILFLDGLDAVIPGIAMAQAIGRWGNYFNSEAHGGPTDLPWAITVDGQMVHPTFLYESLWCLLLFFFLFYIDDHRKFIGQTSLLYGILYSLERFFVEGLRTDSLMIGPFRQAQVISLTVMALCLVMYIILRRRKT